jgi:polar amino acid transport system substrate-binding protein
MRSSPHSLSQAFVILMLTCGPVIASPKCTSKPFVVGIQEVGLLYSNGVGLDKDVIDELQKRSNCEFVLETMPRNRIFSELEAGRIDMTTSVLPTPERLNFLWIYNYMHTEFYAIGLKKNAANFNSMAQFDRNTESKVGVVRGFSYGPILDEEVAKLAANGRVVEVSKIEILFKMLAAERMSVILATPMAYRKYLADEKMENDVAIVDWDLKTDARPRGLALSKKNFSEPAALEWGGLIKAMNQDGTMKRLISKYLNKQETLSSLYK